MGEKKGEGGEKEEGEGREGRRGGGKKGRGKVASWLWGYGRPYNRRQAAGSAAVQRVCCKLTRNVIVVL